ncbi:MAG TPA: tRNA lysidine(34) synthetase TilS [Propionibacteriaceae bacterium]|nr:tRNA lysidine(34) synthetase TilS [Propionibacteriaceae bacterium]
MARRALGPAQLAIVQAVQVKVDQFADPIVVGVSGGADSMALALASHHILGDRVRCLVVDHGLQAGSDQITQRVVDSLAERGIAASSEAVEVVDAGQGPEASARDARHRALLAPEPGTLLLGHTLDDQAETVLLRLARGSGGRSLAGIPPRQGVIVRPLLSVTRATTRQACREWSVDVWDDPHNADPRFLRSRVRAEVMPVLADVLGPGVPEALARTAELSRQDADALDALAASAWRRRLEVDPGEGLDAGWLADLVPAIRTRILRAWLTSQGVGDLGFEHTRAVDSLVTDWRGQAGCSLPGGLSVVRKSGRRLLLTVPAGNS